MQYKTIYLIRHGQTEYNRKGVVQGSGIDAPLNEVGHLQAEAFYNAYRDTPFAHVYTSTLQRSVQSVAQFLKDGLPTTQLSGLNEINWGVKEGKVPSSEEHSYYRQIMEGWQAGKLDVAIEGGESPLMVQERQKPALEHILTQKDEDTILVCMHGRAMRIFLCLLLERDLRTMDQFAHTNLCLYLLRYHYDDQRFELIKENEQSHLPELPPLVREDKTDIK
uniref:Histidine phosphatase family protein n=1 Tax=Roseihalotalea indica TaxID=2867963 RepID=A0AA49GQ22_9BACT|nr:histidine phosphatase family protein [Tunicatimonas sp. TK19036]